MLLLTSQPMYGCGLPPRMTTEEVGPKTDTLNEILCRRIQAGDLDAEAMLVAQLQSGLRLVANRAAGGDFELAHDVCQEALVIIIRRLRTTGLENPALLAAFAAQTARNLVTAARRKTLRQRTESYAETIEAIADPRPAAQEQLSAGGIAAILNRILAELPGERDRTVLIRFYLKEDDKSDICRDLNLSELGFNQVIFRARNRLRQLLIESGFEKRDLLDWESRP
jgi:RNA polymerase sigma-70 factor, ECF subfamily